jgi:hypothetical protein
LEFGIWYLEISQKALFFGLFVYGVLPAPIAKTLVFKLALHLFFVLVGRVIRMLAHGTAQPY